MSRNLPHLVGSLMLLCLLAGCGSTLRQPATPPTEHLRVMTYNVNFGGPAAELAVEAIRESAADVVCLQETNRQWELLLRTELAGQYPHMLFRHWGGAGGLAVLSRWPVAETQYVLPDKGWFPAWVLDARTPIGSLQLVSVHLRPPLTERGSVSIQAYNTGRGTRRSEMGTILQRIDPARPTIVMGDFNERSGDALALLTGRGFVNCLGEFDRRTPTWHWKTSLITLKSRYDHILHSPDLHCYDATVLQRGASDHLPVVAILGKQQSQ